MADIFVSLAKRCSQLVGQVWSRSGTGTCFFVDKNVAITCFHVVGQHQLDGHGNFFAYYTDKLKIVMGHHIFDAVIAHDIRAHEPWIHDYAVLKIQGALDGDLPFFELSTASPELGSSVATFGFPGNLPAPVFLTGRVCGLFSRPFINPLFVSSLILTDLPVHRGNSGGPVINVATGKVVGIVSALEQTIEEKRLAHRLARMKADGVFDEKQLEHMMFEHIVKHPTYRLTASRATVNLVGEPMLERFWAKWREA